MSDNNRSSINSTLCDFVITELIHDFGDKIDGTDPGPEKVNMVSSKRYNKSRQQFNKILDLGVPNCEGDYVKYDEPNILKRIAGANIKTDIENKLIQDKEITTINGNIYHVSISDRTIQKNSESGIEFFKDLNFGYYRKERIGRNYQRDSGTDTPVILADTYSWTYGLFKKGPGTDQNGERPKIYIYSPLVVLADSASKVNITDKKKMKCYFDNEDGVELINVIDEARFEAPKFTIDYPGFFSNFKVTTYSKNGDIEQEWGDLKFQGNNIKSVLRFPAGELNNKRNTFNRMTQLMNSKPPQTEKSNLDVINKISQIGKPGQSATEEIAKQRKIVELLNIEFQSKRSGDWLPVIYILQYAPARNNTIKLITYKEPEIKEQIQDNRLDYFYKENMYILTVDTPLVAFTLYCGINVLYITHDGKLVKFEAHPDNTFNL